MADCTELKTGGTEPGFHSTSPWVERYDTQWMAVRCCCVPERVLGFVLVRLGTPGQERPHVVDQDGQRHPLRLDWFGGRRGAWQGLPGGNMASVAGDIAQPWISRERAIHTEDRPIEFWRTIRGFVEARHE